MSSYLLWPALGPASKVRPLSCGRVYGGFALCISAQRQASTFGRSKDDYSTRNFPGAGNMVGVDDSIGPLCMTDRMVGLSDIGSCLLCRHV